VPSSRTARAIRSTSSSLLSWILCVFRFTSCCFINSD